MKNAGKLMLLKLPKDEKVWVSFCKEGEPHHIVTSKPTREWYFLYSVSADGTLTKVAKSRFPPDLYDKITNAD